MRSNGVSWGCDACDLLGSENATDTAAFARGKANLALLISKKEF
jgi:hypothetical protein